MVSAAGSAFALEAKKSAIRTAPTSTLQDDFPLTMINSKAFIKPQALQNHHTGFSVKNPTQADGLLVAPLEKGGQEFRLNARGDWLRVVICPQEPVLGITIESATRD
jgi:hypothetical protein